MEESREKAVEKGQEKGTEQEKMEKEPAKGRKGSIWQEYIFAADVKLKECRYCRVLIPKAAKVCPNCKMDLRSHWFFKTVVAIFAVALIGAGSYCLSAYWGLIDGSAIPGWAARSTATVPAMSAAPVETAQVTVAVASGAEAAAVAGTEPSSDEESSGATATVEKSEAKADGETDGKEGTASSGVTGVAGKSETAVDEETDGKAGTATSGATGVAGESEAKAEGESDGKAGAVTSGATGVAGKSETAVDEESTETAADEETAEEAEVLDEDEAAFRAECVRRSYKSLLREQEKYLDTAVRLEAEVVCQVDGGLFDESIYYLCVEEENSGIERHYIVRDDRETDDTLLLEGDRITVYGRLFGKCRIPAGLIENRPAAPAIGMLSCDLEEE